MSEEFEIEKHQNLSFVSEKVKEMKNTWVLFDHKLKNQVIISWIYTGEFIL